MSKKTVAVKNAKSVPIDKAQGTKNLQGKWLPLRQTPSVSAMASSASIKWKKGKSVFYFGDGQADGDGTLLYLLGGKGANLAEMTRIGLPVPPGFTISTEVCSYYYKHRYTYPRGLENQLNAALQKVEQSVGQRLGDTENPLLLSVRSGARDSMPGMMDTILNLGMNDEIVEIIGTTTSNPRFAWDAYRRFLQMYGDVVMGVQRRADEHHDPFEEVIHTVKQKVAVEDDNELSVNDLKRLVAYFKTLIKERSGRDFPQNPLEQLWGAIGAVFRSWQNDRAIVYRRKYGIPHEWGTAVNIQTMVFGNKGPSSATGVAFTRNPATGEATFYGEYLINAQGEDVVAGVRTPQPVAELQKDMPRAYHQLLDMRHVLEKHFRDMQDLEFTIEQNRLYILQTRSGKRTGLAAIKIAVEMVREQLISQEEAILRISADSLSHVLAPIFDLASKKSAQLIATGLPAGPGAASGRIFFQAEDAVANAKQGIKVLLVRVETSPEDLRGMIAAEGILTSRGGVSSHAALVARQMGKVCVCGASTLRIDYTAKTMITNETTLKEGDFVSIDGTTGEVFAGEVKTTASEVVQVLVNKTLDPAHSTIYRYFARLMAWANKYSKLHIRANADTPAQVSNAIAFGAQGIGLCRTEHMFFEGDRIDAMREMVLASTLEERRAALEKLLPYQRNDFVGILRALSGLPATIRLLDPPLHEFLPSDSVQQRSLAGKLNIPVEILVKRVHELHEFNPMLGFRGCRLGMVYPEISEMQAYAIFEAAALVQKEGVKVRLEIMIPLVGFVKEFKIQKALVQRVAKDVAKKQKTKFHYVIGTMIEVPRAVLIADEIAEDADFFSFGTNDLTQTSLGMSRDDAGSFLQTYVENEILPGNPFASIDQGGVGRLMEIAVDGARKTKPSMKFGICGEHGGEPNSVRYFHNLGLTYVSCSPFRIPIARIAAAQANLHQK